ncbi:MAG: transporter substrate-binding domain-containing protein [Planctomycetes bacterium]|nr:transporter substrate-binding domain-containing protein [Planctomycetota bacterium]
MHYVLAIFLFMCTVISASGGAVEAAFLPPQSELPDGYLPPDIERIRKRGKLVVALRPDSGPPLCGESDGELSGVEVDIARAMALQLGVELEINREPITPEDALLLVRERKVDLALANLARTAYRSLVTPFGQPYLISHATLIASDAVTSNDDGFIDSGIVIANLNTPGIRIGVQKGAYHEDLIAEIFPLATMVPVAGDWYNTEDMYFSGQVDAVMVEDLRSVILFRRTPELTVYNSVFIMKDREELIAPAFHWQDRNLRLWYDVWIREWLPKPYTIADIVEQFPELTAPREEKEK